MNLFLLKKRALDALHRYRSSQLARNTGWMLIGQGAGFFCQAAYFVLLARLLGSAEYGVFAGAFAFTSILASYSPLGTGTILLRYVSGDPKAFAPYWGNILMVTLGTSGFLVLCLFIVAPHFLNAASAQLVLPAAISNCLCAQLTTEIGRIFQSFEKMRFTALMNLLTNLARVLTAASMLMLMHHASAWQWAVASMTVSGLATLVSVITVLIYFGKPIFRFSIFRKHAWEGVGFAFASSTSSIYNDLDKTMMSHYGMNQANGIYTMAYRIIDFATMPVFSIRDAAIPRIFIRGRSGLRSASEFTYQLLKKVFLVNIMIFVGLILIAPFVPRMVGHGFIETVIALRWLALIPLFRGIHQMMGSALTGSGLQRYRTGAQLTAAGLNLGLNIWLIPKYGWRGAAWASLLTDGALALMNTVIVRLLVKREGRQSSPLTVGLVS